MEEFEKLVAESFQNDLLPAEGQQAQGESSESAAVQPDSSEIEASKTT
jgi:hypothetical protein